MLCADKVALNAASCIEALVTALALPNVVHLIASWTQSLYALRGGTLDIGGRPSPLRVLVSRHHRLRNVRAQFSDRFILNAVLIADALEGERLAVVDLHLDPMCSAFLAPENRTIADTIFFRNGLNLRAIVALELVYYNIMNSNCWGWR
jgi:hypothetical protein